MSIVSRVFRTIQYLPNGTKFPKSVIVFFLLSSRFSDDSAPQGALPAVSDGFFVKGWFTSLKSVGVSTHKSFDTNISLSVENHYSWWRDIRWRHRVFKILTFVTCFYFIREPSHMTTMKFKLTDDKQSLSIDTCHQVICIKFHIQSSDLLKISTYRLDTVNLNITNPITCVTVNCPFLLQLTSLYLLC